MEASLLDMTRHVDPVVVFAALDPARAGGDDDYDVVIEYVFEHAPIEDAFADPWFCVHDDALALHDDVPVTPGATPRSLHTVLGVAAAVAMAALLYSSTL